MVCLKVIQQYRELIAKAAEEKRRKKGADRVDGQAGNDRRTAADGASSSDALRL